MVSLRRAVSLVLAAVAPTACADTPVGLTPDRAPMASAAFASPVSSTPLPALTYVVEDLLPGTVVERFRGGVLVGAGEQIVIETGGGDHVLLDGTPVPLESASSGNPWEIGRGGRVIGWTVSNGTFEPAVWDAGALGVLPGGPGTAFDINAAGTIIGASEGTFGELLVWSGGGVQKFSVPGYDLLAPRYVNDDGVVLMGALVVDPVAGVQRRDALLWNAGAVTVIPPVCGDMLVAAARGYEWLNDSGQAIGRCSADPRQWYWDGSTARAVPTLGGAFTTLNQINDAGLAAGQSQDAAGQRHAAVYDGSTLHDLGLMGGDDTFAVGIDDAGVVGGVIVHETTGPQPFVTQAFVTEAGAPRLLPTLGGGEAHVRDVGDSGVIVGSAQDRTGAYRAVVWRPASSGQIVANMQSRLDELTASGSIARGPARAMRATLDAGALRGFIAQVEGLVAGGLVDPEVGQSFIDAARTALAR